MARPRRSLWRSARLRMRLGIRRLGRRTPEWMKWLTPWGVSLAFHSLLLLGLGLVIIAFNPPSKGERDRIRGEMVADVTSGGDSDHTGDPFTNIASKDEPSLSLEANPSPLAAISVPKLPESYIIGPSVNNIPPDTVPLETRRPGEAAKGIGKVSVSNRGLRVSEGAFDARLPLMAPFSGRSPEERSRMVRREGGSAESEKAVEDGIDWIARHQRPDGGWSLDTRAMCAGTSCPDEGPGMFSDTAATGLALLPILGAGHKHTLKGKYQKTLEHGLFWLIKQQKPSGELFTGGGKHTLYYSHAIATMALCEAYGLTKDKRLRDPAQKAIFYINRSQNKVDGGWRYVFGEPSDTSVFGWQLFAMRSAHLAGLETNRTVLKRARDYLDRVAASVGGSTYSYMVGRRMSYSMTAEGLVCRQLMGWSREHPAMLAGTSLIADHLMGSEERNIYYWYYATQLLHNMKNKDWERWNVRVRDGLVSMQTPAGKNCDAGSWDPSFPQEDLWGTMGGRLYTTSLSLLTLEVYYRYLPLYRDPGDEMPGSDRDPDEMRERPIADVKKAK